MMVATTHPAAGLQEIHPDHLDEVAGGAVALVPLAIAFGRGVLLGASIVGVGGAFLDAMDLIDV